MPWKLAGHRAELATDKLQLTIDVSQPRAGISGLDFADQSLTGLRPLQITAHPPVTTESVIESYVRGPDLIVTYAQLPARTVRPQLYYHALDAAELSDDRSAGVELVIGMQTSLLDSDPVCSSVTEAAADELYALTTSGDWERLGPGDQEVSVLDLTGAFVFRLRESKASYVELILPADFQGAQLRRPADLFQLSYQLFPEFLEKGVIRKGRVWGVLTPRERDLETAGRCVQQLVAAPPPLTV